MVNNLSRKFEIVVAHYNEDLSWLQNRTTDCKVYAKGDLPTLSNNLRCMKLPNIGREGHTYLHHITTCYDQLADITLFAQGRIDDHVAGSIDEIKDICLDMDQSQVLTFPSTDAVSTELIRFDEWDGIQWQSHPSLDKWIAMDMKPAEQTPAMYFAQFLGNGKVPLSIGYTSGAVFAVSRQLIQSYPVEFYKKLLDGMFLGCMKHVNPETGFYMERFWLAIWEPKEYICWSKAEISKSERNSRGELAKGRWRPIPGLKITSDQETDSHIDYFEQGKISLLSD
ncbi:Ankyrin repeat protein [Rutstroemia sp. NJR-2017a BVV2]|nr:Ankyrin repeat protein [Rutstroemia sp. NJR-2017a BVV2]